MVRDLTKNSTQNDAAKNLLLQACGADGEHCPFAPELTRLREEVQALHALVRTDELTELFNYRHFLHSLDLEMERARRSGRFVSLVMMDLDHFKGFNDRWGHAVGNLALQHVARIVQSTLRRLDIPCRYGGEEFAIILPDTPVYAAIRLAERLRRDIAETALTVGDEKVYLTASFGVDSLGPQERCDLACFVARTDAWLYAAKKGGRNCVQHAPEQAQTHVSKEERDLLLGN